MDELYDLTKQRTEDIDSFQNQGQKKEKSLTYFLNREKQRITKENWILKVFKSVKVQTAQFKKDIYEKSKLMIELSEGVCETIQNAEGVSTTEKIINLFVSYFNQEKQSEAEDRAIQVESRLRSILRPSNAHLLTDLIKLFVEQQRKRFKNSYSLHSQVLQQIQRRRWHKKQQISKQQQSLFCSQQHNPQDVSEEINQVPQSPIDITNDLKSCQIEKYKAFIKQVDLKNTEQVINDLYVEMKEKNSRNAMFIEKFRDLCIGPKKSISYDASGLYTKEEIKRMIEKQRSKQSKDEREKSQEQILKAQFEKQMEISENNFLMNKSTKIRPLHEWFPVALMKKPSKSKPWQIVILKMKDKSKFRIGELAEDLEISALGLKGYLLQTLKTTEQGQSHTTSEEMIKKGSFKKKLFLDYGLKKQHQMLEGDKYMSVQKEVFLPTLKQNQSKQLSVLSKNKSQSIKPNDKIDKSKFPQIRSLSNQQQKFSIKRTKSEQKIISNGILIQPKTQNHKQNPKKFLITGDNATSQNPYLHQSISNDQMFQSLELRSPLNSSALQMLMYRKRQSLENVVGSAMFSKKLQNKVLDTDNQRRYRNRINILFGEEQAKSMEIRSKARSNKIDFDTQNLKQITPGRIHISNNYFPEQSSHVTSFQIDQNAKKAAILGLSKSSEDA